MTLQSTSHGEIVKILLFLLSLGMCGDGIADSRINYKIVTGSERGTYVEIGRDLAKWAAAPADIDLEVLPSKGSTENVSRLRYEPGVKLALVQSDVYQGMLDAARGGNASAAQLIRPLRVVMPLYAEEIYFVTRADSQMKFIHHLKGKRINVGPLGSGTALSATTLYNLMFGEPLPESNATYLSNEEALVKLTVDRSVDVVVIVAGQPAKLFVDMKPEARQFIKFLRLDEKAVESTRATKTYFPAAIHSVSYPTWIREDIPTLTVQALLVTYDFGTKDARRNLTRFSKSLCANFGNLQMQGHPKWKQVRMELPPLGPGWSYYQPTTKILRRCSAKPEVILPADSGASVKHCDQQQKVLGLCR